MAKEDTKAACNMLRGIRLQLQTKKQVFERKVKAKI